MSRSRKALMPSEANVVVDENGRFTKTWFRLIEAIWQRTGGATDRFAEDTPTGSVVDFAASAAPDGWLVCDGSAVSRANYATLFSVIGVNFGVGDGSTTFNLPDLRGRLSLGVSVSHTLASTGGSENVTLVIANMPSHTHNVTDGGHTHTATDSGHTHGVTDPTHTHNITDVGHNHEPLSGSFVSNTTGTGVYATGGLGDAQITTGTSTTGITINNASTGVSVDSGAANVTNSSSTTGISIDSAGSGTSFSILPPYMALYKIIKT